MIRKREKDRRKEFLKTKYGQKPLKHAKKGVQSCLFGGIVLILLLLTLISSFAAKGEVGMIMGAVGLGIVFVASRGLMLGIKGFRERDKNYISCKIGTILNSGALLGMAAIFIRGLF